MNRFIFHLGVLLLHSTLIQAAEKLPNVVIIFMDDMGFGDPGGLREARTN